MLPMYNHLLKAFVKVFFTSFTPSFYRCLQCVKKKKENIFSAIGNRGEKKVVTTGTDLVYSHGTVGYSAMITHVKTLTCEKLNLIFSSSHILVLKMY